VTKCFILDPLFSPPKLSQRLAELRIVKMGVLVGQLPPCSLVTKKQNFIVEQDILKLLCGKSYDDIQLLQPLGCQHLFASGRKRK